MNIATHRVEVPFPQAFASPRKKRSPFPSAPPVREPRGSTHWKTPLAVRRACALLRDSTLALPLLLDEHGSIFTPDPSSGNPSKHYSVIKVLDQVYQGCLDFG